HDRYQQSLTIFEELGDRAGMATTHHQLGILAQDRGDHDTAHKLYEQSLHIKKELGDRAGMATTHGQLGVLAHDQSHYDTAHTYYQRALTIFEELGNRAGMANTYHQLGMLAQDQGDSPSRILYFLERSLECAESIPATMQTIKIVISIGVHALQVDAVELAIRAFFWLLHTALTNTDQTKTFGVAIAGFRELYQSGYSAKVDSALAPLLAELPPESAQQLQSLIETDDGDGD
ncbi:tetratricopeptide repeat protein, partial [Actinomyces dentalis]|uniref:tetratricopeptide repeat protein n=1 Tax=Actinomyces dentalis TaxID=272548 RepID=UPI0028E76E93